MIEREIYDIIEDPAYDGTRLNELIDQFRAGRDVIEIMDLLNSADDKLVSLGVYILHELPMELYDFNPFIAKLMGLTDHEKPLIRNRALDALFPILDLRDPVWQAMLSKLGNDPHEGVRISAQQTIECLSAKLKSS